MLSLSFLLSFKHILRRVLTTICTTLTFLLPLFRSTSFCAYQTILYPIYSLLHVDICSQPKEVGPCRGYFPRWYFDSSKGICLQFIYGGCRGNKNNFEHFEECNRMCQINSEGKNGALVFLIIPSLAVLLPSLLFCTDNSFQPCTE